MLAPAVRASVLALLGLSACSAPEQFDVVLTGGTVVDGNGGPGFVADVGIRDGKIARIGDLKGGSAAERVDVSGLVVAPGFIDVHSHTAEAIAENDKRWNEGILRMGVTTIVGGPDGGFEPARIRELLAAYEKQGIGTNVAFYVGHNGIRSAVMKDSQRRPPSAEELSAMKSLVREGMELGAVGLSTGLMYEPGLFSETEELVELAREVKPFGGLFESHVRNPGHDLLGSDREVIDVARRAGIPGRIAHEKAVGLENKGLIAEVVKLVEAARAEGLDITTDQYPYDGAATARLEEIIVVPEEMASEGELDLRAALRDPVKRRVLRKTSEQGIDGGFAWLKATGYSHMRITSAPGAPELVGRYLSELAEERKQTGFDLVSELIIESEGPIGITLGAIAEEDVQALLVQSWNMIASDGGYPGGDPGEGHPRSAGTFPRVLGHYVRELEVLGLEDAVRKMTSLPASNIGLRDRGRLAEGAAADLVVFDPETILDRSTWEEPHRYSEGIRHALVNGVFAIRNEALTGATSGRHLRASRP
ncbi:MAG: N-acyl-D-amino-acid deacylase family protein [Vicinamibacteria bacterium]